ncbi:unnamed protein product [marine sediment metagenome]|uniref:Uncharacterized protein n=1 Tax=marine sediment metagenome TaxID=412755 RepID=X1DHD2_9ZZZZ
MKYCNNCGSKLLYLFEFNNYALLGCEHCKRVYFIEVNKFDMDKNGKFEISNLVEEAVLEYIEKRKSVKP